MLEAEQILDSYTGNDRTDEYGFNFKITDEANLQVTVTDRNGVEIPLSLGVDYSVDGVGDDAGGFITLIDSGQEFISSDGFLETFYGLLIRHNPAMVQDEDLRNTPTYDPIKHERAVDKVVAQLTAVKDLARRAIRIPESETVGDMSLPEFGTFDNTLLGFTSGGEPIPVRSVIDSNLVSDYTRGLVDDRDAIKARQTLGFTGDHGTISTLELENDAVTTAKFKDGAVTTSKIDDEDIVLAKVSTTLIHSLAAVTPSVDDHLLSADASDGLLHKKNKIATTVNINAYRDISSNYTVVTEDCFLNCSGSAFNITLYTAVGYAGREIEIFHAGDNFVTYTLYTTGGQTVGGIASGSYSLCTNGESLKLRSDGTNWRIVNHFCNTVWVESGAVEIGASITAPTKGTATIHVDEMWWRRIGDSAEIRFIFTKTVSGTATNGSGDYIFKVPTGMVIDTAKATPEGTDEGAGLSILKKSIVGHGFNINNSTAQQAHCAIAVYDSTGVSMTAINMVQTPSIQFATICSTDFALALNNEKSYRGIFTVPMVGWKQ